MKILAIIPARGGSKSIPRKNIKLLGGVPMIAYSIAAAKQSKLIDRIVVSTDDTEIAEISRKFGAETPFMRPSDLAMDTTRDLPVFKNGLAWLKENQKYEPDIVVQLRPTSPFRPPGLVDDAINLLLNNTQADSVRSVIPSGQNPYKMWRIKKSGFLSPLLNIAENTEPYNTPRQELPRTFWQTGHIDVIRYSTIINKASLSGKNIIPFIIDPYYAIDIDTESDWARAEWLIKNFESSIVRP